MEEESLIDRGIEKTGAESIHVEKWKMEAESSIDRGMEKMGAGNIHVLLSLRSGKWRQSLDSITKNTF